MTYAIVRGPRWLALAVRLPERLAALAPAPVACLGLGLTRADREAARRAVIIAAHGLLP